MARSCFVDVMLVASLMPILGGLIRRQPNDYLSQKPYFEYTAFDEFVWSSKGWVKTTALSVAMCTGFITACVAAVYVNTNCRSSRRVSLGRSRQRFCERAIGKGMSSKVVCSGSETNSTFIEELESQIHGDRTDSDKLEESSQNDTTDEYQQPGASSSSLALPLLHNHSAISSALVTVDSGLPVKVTDVDPNAIISFAADGMPRKVVHRDTFDAMMEVKAKFNAIMDLWSTRVRPGKGSKSSFHGSVQRLA